MRRARVVVTVMALSAVAVLLSANALFYTGMVAGYLIFATAFLAGCVGVDKNGVEW